MSGCNKTSQSKRINRLAAVFTGGQKSFSLSFNSGNPTIYKVSWGALGYHPFSPTQPTSLEYGRERCRHSSRLRKNQTMEYHEAAKHTETQLCAKDFYFSLVSFTSFRDPLLFILSSNCSFFHVLTFRHLMRSCWRWKRLRQRKGGDLTPCSTSLSPHE